MLIYVVTAVATRTHNTKGRTMGYTSAQMVQHTETQHNRKGDLSLWDTLARRRDHIQIHKTQHNII
jgi:hypothetical protein